MTAQTYELHVFWQGSKINETIAFCTEAKALLALRTVTEWGNVARVTTS